MLARSSSSRRRRASRSAASSPQGRQRAPPSPSISPARRASVAITSSSETLQIPKSPRRSPRHSLAPNLDISPCTPDMDDDILTIPILDRSPRNSICPDIPSFNKSPRHSLAPDYNRSARNSLLPDDAADARRSHRKSLVPESALSPRNSLCPGMDRSPRHSLTPDMAHGSRLSLNPPEYNKSPRNSLVPDNMSRSPRNSLVPDSSSWSQHRNSLVPEVSKSQRHSLTPSQADFNRSPRGSISGESTRVSPRGSIGDGSRSPRGSIAGGLLGDLNKKEYNFMANDRSPRGSLGGILALDIGRSPRGSIGGGGGILQDMTSRSPRGSLGGESRGARGSLTLTFQEPPARRSSDDNGASASRGRSSPYSGYQSGSGRYQGYDGNQGEAGSRRASSSVSQASGDEQRRLCGGGGSMRGGGGGNSGCVIPPPRALTSALTTYGSVAYQLKDANMEATSTCDFVCRAMHIVNRTVVVTVILACLSTLPIVMLIMGFQFLRDCPIEPHIPLYMIIGGTLGGIKLAWLLYDQLAARTQPSIGVRLASVSLTLLLLVWFGLGNYWVLKVKWPDFEPTRYEPNKWCHKTLYTFSMVHLFIVYSIFSVIVILIIVFAVCQMFGCPWLGPSRYK